MGTSDLERLLGPAETETSTRLLTAKPATRKESATSRAKGIQWSLRWALNSSVTCTTSPPRTSSSPFETSSPTSTDRQAWIAGCA